MDNVDLTKEREEISQLSKEIQDSMKATASNIALASTYTAINQTLSKLRGISDFVTDTFEDLYQAGLGRNNFFVKREEAIQEEILDVMNKLKEIKALKREQDDEN